MKSIQTLKRQVIRNIKTMIAPHVWSSGYLKDDKTYMKIFAFADVNGSDTRSMGKVFNEDLSCLQGFHLEGTIDAFGGGCMCAPFSSYCLEDLLAIEKWLVHNLAKEVTRAKVDLIKRREFEKKRAVYMENYKRAQSMSVEDIFNEAREKQLAKEKQNENKKRL